MGQKLHEQSAQEIANNQIMKLANEVQLLESKLVLSDTLRNDAVNEMEIMRKQRDVAIENCNLDSVMEEMQEDRADFNGMIAGWSVAANAALVACFLFYLMVAL